ncbi:MAG: glycosyltransferase, partial [Pirellulaceae bacterium]|nr:glycosyltransferase [Pirellulaceae bacterium]
MKLLLCHNYYQQPGGEDQVFAAEGRLLRSRGHHVVEYTKHNDDIKRMGRWEAAKKTVWNGEVYEELRELIRSERPDILHATNIFPLISPAAYAAARDEGVPVVQSLHNYRLICPKALLMRDGRACESCLGKRFAWPAVVHACYRGSRAATAVVGTMLAVHRRRGTWTQSVDRYIALTEFARQKLIEGGLPANAITVKPNFLPEDPGPGDGLGGYSIYVGRLSAEKGVDVLLDAWSRIDGDIPLRIVGDGPLAETVRAATADDPRVRWLGQKPHDEVLDLIGDARFLVFPSICFETFGLTTVEAFAKGTPVVASRLGAMQELVS